MKRGVLSKRKLKMVEELWSKGAGALVIVHPSGEAWVYSNPPIYLHYTVRVNEDGLEYGLLVPFGVMDVGELKRLLRELKPPPLLVDALKFIAEKVVPRLQRYGRIKRIEVGGAEKWYVEVIVEPWEP